MKRFCTWAGLAVCALWLAGCASGPAHPALVGGQLPDLVPVRDFVASRQSTGGYRVSPDGQRIAWFGVDGVVPAIWVQPIDGGSAKAFRIRARSIRFSADSRWLGITADLTGDENTRIFAGEVEGPGTDLRELMPAPRSVAHFVDAVEGTADFTVTSNQRDKKVFDLYRVSAAGGAPVLLATNPGNVNWWGVDLDSVTLSRRTREPLVANFMPGYPARQVFDPALAARLSALAGEQSAEVFVTSMDRTDTVLTVAVSTDRGTRSYLLREGHEPRFLGENRLSLIAKDLAPTRPITYTARDGLTVHGYLTLPQGVAQQSLPMVLLVHGGPWARDRWGDGATSRAMQQFLANRGYAVLQVNYRGSSGYGRSHMEKARGEFAGRMHDDLVDGVRWAVEQGVADPTRVAIYGASYGGYSALVGATFTPEVFACAVDVVGVTDIARLLEAAPPYWELGLPWWHRYVGNPAVPEDRARMDAKSPLYRAEHAQKPILVMHGVNDPRVKLDQSERMVAALRKAGKEVDYVTFTGDGHGNQKWSNNLTMYRKTEDFLAQCLGGRTGGFDYYQLGAWAF